MFDYVVDSRYGCHSVDYAQQRRLDVSDHYVFEQIAAHVDVGSTGGQEHRSFGINLFFIVRTPEPVVLIRLEAKHRRKVVAEVHPITGVGEVGKENFD